MRRLTNKEKGILKISPLKEFFQMPALPPLINVNENNKNIKRKDFVPGAIATDPCSKEVVEEYLKVTKRKKPIKLTPKNYHSDKNKYLTNSKISLFLKSKEWYKARYIDKTEESESTPSILVGKAVDLAFEKGSISAIDKEFVVMGLKEYKDSQETRERLTEEQMIKAKEMSTKLLNSDLYKEINKTRSKRYRKFPPDLQSHFQEVFVDEKLGYAGMIDLYIKDEWNKIIKLIDLKTSAVMAMKSKNSYFYHCLDYGYFRQLAGYKHLLQLRNPNYTIECYHLVIGSSDYYPMKLFKFDDELINQEWPFIELMIEAIKNETLFKDPTPTWDDTILITQPEKK